MSPMMTGSLGIDSANKKRTRDEMMLGTFGGASSLAQEFTQLGIQAAGPGNEGQTIEKMI